MLISLFSWQDRLHIDYKSIDIILYCDAIFFTLEIIHMVNKADCYSSFQTTG